MNRQPRSSAVVIGALLLAGAVTWFVLRVSRRARGHEQVVLPVALGVVLVAAVVLGFAWPGGLLRHDVAPPEADHPTEHTADHHNRSDGDNRRDGCDRGHGREQHNWRHRSHRGNRCDVE